MRFLSDDEKKAYAHKVIDYLEYIGADDAMDWHPIPNEIKGAMVKLLIKSSIQAGHSHRIAALGIFSCFETSRLHITKILEAQLLKDLSGMKES